MDVLLVDGNNIAFRSFAVGGLSWKGENTGAIYGTLRAVLAARKEARPDRTIVCWDHGKSEWRQKLYPEYKAGRKEDKARQGFDLVDFHRQILILWDAFTYLGVCQLTTYGVEADDLIGILAARANGNVTILSNDRDFCQLLSPTVSILREKKERFTVSKFRREYGFSPQRWTTFRALSGDPSDNIPGLPGIGPARAKKLMTLGDLDAMAGRENWYPTLQACVREHLEEAKLYERVSTIARDLKPFTREQRSFLKSQVPFVFGCSTKPFPLEFARLCARYGMLSLSKEVV
jgi:DNA polymerase-1